MNSYQAALAKHLERYAKQEEFATKIGRPQGTLSRYATGARFPDAATARKIHEASDGEVSFALWQAVALQKIGIAA